MLDLSALPEEELLLFEAVEGVGLHYIPLGEETDHTKFQQHMRDIVLHYGFYHFEEGKFIFNDEQFSIQLKLCADIESRYYGSILARNEKLDHRQLNKRSFFMLVFLCEMTNSFMTQDRYGTLFHNHFGSCQKALHKLEAFNLVTIDERQCAFWTREGQVVLANYPYLGEFLT